MGGYIGSKASVAQVDGYNRSEADAEFVNDPNGAITVSGSNIGIGTSSPAEKLSVEHSGDVAIEVKSTGTGDADASLIIDAADTGEAVLAFRQDGAAKAFIEWFSAGSPDFNFRTAAGTNGVFDFQPNNSLAMRIDSSGNVGIGTSSPESTPSTKLHIREDDSTDYRARAVVQASDQRLVLGSHWQAGVAQYSYVQATNDAETGAQNLLLNPDGGNLLVGATANTTSSKVGTIATSGVVNGFGVNCTTTAVTGAVVFFNPNGQVGTISVTGSSTAYVTSSDYRLKTDVQPMTGASARVQALKPVNFEWIADGTRVDGFLAHEAQEVAPEAVTGTKDAMRDEEYEVTPAVLDDDGAVVTEAVMGTRSVPDYQGIDQSKLVPLLTAALQEALTKIDDMETRLAALEGS